MLVLADVERGEGAVEAARRDHRHLALEIDEAFENGRRAAERAMQRREVGALADQRLALAVIAEAPRLEDRRAAERGDRAHQRAGVLDGGETARSQAEVASGTSFRSSRSWVTASARAPGAPAAGPQENRRSRVGTFSNS